MTKIAELTPQYNPKRISEEFSTLVGTKRFSDIYQQLQNPPAERTVREDLRLLRELGMVELSGHGAGARWKLSEK